MMKDTVPYWCLLISGAEGGRLEQDQLMSGLYSHHAASQRPESSSSASPPSHPHFPASFPSASSGSGMLVVPQPINASKVIQDSLFFSELRLGH